MRTALILGRRHRSESLEVVVPPHLPIVDVKAAFKAALTIGEDPKWGYLELWESGVGVTKKAKLRQTESATPGLCEEVPQNAAVDTPSTPDTAPAAVSATSQPKKKTK